MYSMNARLLLFRSKEDYFSEGSACSASKIVAQK